jgi:hypothetical protein
VSALAVVLAGAAAAAVFAWLVPRLAARTGRPGFVVGIALAAAVVAAFELASALAVADLERFVLGAWLAGRSARLVSLVHAATCAVTALGLWRMRPWARWLAMGVLGYLIATFLIWGVRGGRADVGDVMLWQMLVLPFLTFGFMYLQRGGRYFRR